MAAPPSKITALHPHLVRLRAVCSRVEALVQLTAAECQLSAKMRRQLMADRHHFATVDSWLADAEEKGAGEQAKAVEKAATAIQQWLTDGGCPWLMFSEQTNGTH